MTSVNSVYRHMVDDVPTSWLLVLDQVFRGFSGKHVQGSACRFFWGGLMVSGSGFVTQFLDVTQ